MTLYPFTIVWWALSSQVGEIIFGLCVLAVVTAVYVFGKPEM